MLRYTTTLYASSRPKTHRAHILSSTTTLYAKPRDWSVEVGDDEVYHINHTPPRAGTHRGAAFEHLCNNHHDGNSI